MGNWDIEVGGVKYRCDSREDRNAVLAALSSALYGRPMAIVRSWGGAFRTAPEDDGTIRVTTSSEELGEGTHRFYRETIERALKVYT